MDDLDVLTVHEAAAEIGVHPTAIYQAIKDGRLPFVTLLGKRGIRREDQPTHLWRGQNGASRGPLMAQRVVEAEPLRED